MSVPGRCSICDWPLAASADQGCVLGNCAYRQLPGTEEYRRIQQRKVELAVQHEESCSDSGA